MMNLYIHNDSTGTDESANYEWKVSVNYREIASGTFKGHDRKGGWEELVIKIAMLSLEGKESAYNKSLQPTVNDG